MGDSEDEYTFLSKSEDSLQLNKANNPIAQHTDKKYLFLATVIIIFFFY